MTTDGEVSTFTIPSPPGEWLQMTRGPEDNMCFTAARGGVWRINLAGTIEEILAPEAADAPVDIAAGIDGRLWFTQQGAAPGIGRLDSLAFETLDVAGGAPLGLARGADDSIWFADADRDGTLRINDLIASVTSALQGCSP
jgi:virginiamycin B lyase